MLAKFIESIDVNAGHLLCVLLCVAMYYPVS